MGLMPPYNPLEDASLAWAVVRAMSFTPARPTWSRPAAVTLRVETVLRGTLPPQLVALFDAPREAAQERFYAARSAYPGLPTQQVAEMDERPVPVPPLDRSVIAWLAAPQPVTATEGLPPHAALLPTPPGFPQLPPAPPGGFWTVPSPRVFGQGPVPFSERWIECVHLDAVRAHLGAR